MPQTIGIFDSGIGGLSVLAHARRVMPHADFLYYADTEHVPYGTKGRDEIVRYSLSAAEFLCEKGANAVLVACNTATSMAVDSLRSALSCPVVGMEPAVKPALAQHPRERILVTATPATIKGQKLRDLLQRNTEREDTVDLVALPELVLYAERGFFDISAVSAYIRSCILHTDYTACVLGCTHFPYFRDSFRAILPKADLIDGTAGTVRQLCHVTGCVPHEENAALGGSVRYYRTGREVVNSADLDFYESLQRRSLSLI